MYPDEPIVADPRKSISDAAVVIPAYNEAENLQAVVGRVRAAVPESRVIVVDDGSQDATGDLADRMAAADPYVTAIHRRKHEGRHDEGVGAAYVYGFRVALDMGFAVIGELNANGSHQPEELPALLAALDLADMVLGSRWVPSGAVVNWSPPRRVLSRLGNRYAGILLQVPVRDPATGFRLFRRPVLESIDLDAAEGVEYSFQIDLTHRVARAGFRTAEVPITYIERKDAESMPRLAVARESILRVTRWGYEDRVSHSDRHL